MAGEESSVRSEGYDDAVAMMARHARECLALKRGGPDDRFLEGVVTGICVGLNCLGADNELRALEVLMKGGPTVACEGAAVMTLDELINKLRKLRCMDNLPGTTPVLVDALGGLFTIGDCDLGGSDEGVVIWVGGLAE